MERNILFKVQRYEQVPQNVVIAKTNKQTNNTICTSFSKSTLHKNLWIVEKKIIRAMLKFLWDFLFKYLMSASHSVELCSHAHLVEDWCNWTLVPNGFTQRLFKLSFWDDGFVYEDSNGLERPVTGSKGSKVWPSFQTQNFLSHYMLYFEIWKNYLNTLRTPTYSNILCEDFISA